MKLLILTVVAVTTFADAAFNVSDIEDLRERLEGDWTPVKIHPPAIIKDNAVCFSSYQNVTDQICNCNGKDAPTLIRSNTYITNEIPIIIADSDQEVKESLNATCICDSGEAPTHMVMRYVNENYLVFYDKNYGEKDALAIIVAKKPPKTAELEEFIAKIDYLKNEVGTILCTSDFKPPQRRKSPYDDILEDFYKKINNIVKNRN